MMSGMYEIRGEVVKERTTKLIADQKNEQHGVLHII